LYSTKNAANKTKVVRSLIRERIIPRVPRKLSKFMEMRTIRNAKFALRIFQRVESRRIKRIIDFCRVRVCGITRLVKKPAKRPTKVVAKVPVKKPTKSSGSASGSKKPTGSASTNGSASGSASVKPVAQLPVKGPSFVPGTHPGYGKK